MGIYLQKLPKDIRQLMLVKEPVIEYAAAEVITAIGTERRTVEPYQYVIIQAEDYGYQYYYEPVFV